MEVILKPTSRCNFFCTYCSAGKMNILHLDHIPNNLKEKLLELNPNRIIITGGDPLTLDPEIYFLLLDLGNWTISFTTNLKDFYLNSNKWIELFKHPRIGICTSFQYGDSRKWDKNIIYSEEMFKNVFYRFLDLIGYRLTFISVISNENEKYALKHLELAKELKTKCKINGLMKLGLSNDFYPMYKLILLYLKIENSDLKLYIDNDIALHKGGCNFNINRLCESTIKAICLDKNEKLKIATCEDDLTNEIFNRKRISISDHINQNCKFCELFLLCNSCNQYRELNKLTKNHCQEMLNLKDQILRSGWKIQ